MTSSLHCIVFDSKSLAAGNGANLIDIVYRVGYRPFHSAEVNSFLGLYSTVAQSRKMPHLLSRLTPWQRLLLSFTFLILLLPARAQTPGITVGQPKLYDNQSLSIMLDQLSVQLGQVRTIDQSSLAKTLGLVQGSQQQDVSTGFSIAAAPAATSSPPATSPLPELLSAPSYAPSYGESSLDLLSDQVDLSYQIFNLRMLLERSVTDRLRDGQPRRQAVVGFNITLDPPKNMAGAAAYVEITLTSSGGPLSLVASMPQEKTYNATSLSTSAHAMGAAAVAKVVSVSYNRQRRKQIFFLYRDCDTLAIERPADTGKVTFGWVFRPVLGRKSVSPGMRQMFAVVALPNTDPSNPSSDPSKEPPMLKVRATTRWVHFDQESGTVNEKYPGFWHWLAKSLPEAKTVDLSDLPTLATRTVEEGLGANVTNVRTFQTTNSNTTLEISGTNFYPGTTVRIGDKTFSGPKDGLFVQSSQTMVLTANADLLTGALSAVVNGRYGPPSPLYRTKQPGIVIWQSEISPKGPNYSTLRLMVDAFDSSGLSMADIKDYPDPILTLNGTRIAYRASFQDTRQGDHKYVMATVDIPNSLLQPEDNRAGILFPLLGESWSAEDLIYDSDAVQVTKMSSGKTTTLLIARPGREFSGNWRIVLDKTYSLTDPPSTTITRAKTLRHPAAKRVKGKASANDKAKIQEVEFSRLVPCQKFKTDINRCSMVRLAADSKFLSSYQKFVLISDTGYAQTIDLSASAAAKEKSTAATKNALKIDSVEPSTVGLNEVVTVTVTGTGLESVKHVSFDGKPLTFWKGEEKAGGKTSPAPAERSDHSGGKPEQPPGQLEVLLSRDLTAKEGHQTFLLQGDDKTVATASITVGPAPTATVISPAKSSEAKEKTP